MRHYADASFVVELVSYGPFQDEAWECLDGIEETVLMSRLTRLEVWGTLHRLHLQNEISGEDKDEAQETFKKLVSAARLLPQSLKEQALYSAAENLITCFSSGIACKSADVLHVAAAMQLQCRVFLTFDHQQGNLARSAGLNTPLVSEERSRNRKPFLCPHCGNDIQKKPATGEVSPPLTA